MTLRGWGVAATYGGAGTQPNTRQVGTNTLDAVGADFAWVADRTVGSGGNALLLSGDSGGPLIWYPTSTTPTVLGTASGTNTDGSGAVLSYWSNTTRPMAAAWINSVMTLGTDESAQVTTGGTSPPPSGWLGEGTDSPQGDNCPNVFNPWQTDTDGDGVGDECDVSPSATWSWGAASIAADGKTLSSYNATGAPILATVPSTGRYLVSVKQLASAFGNVQVVATGPSSTRCKVAAWYPAIGGHETIDVRCHNAAGAPAASPFIVYFNNGASGQGGAYLFYGGSVWSGYTWNSTGGTNSVSHTSTGKYTVYIPGFSFDNFAVHVTAYGTGAEYCNVENWGWGSFNVACYGSTGAAVDTDFSFMISNGAMRSGLVGGHAWVNGTTSAPSGYQMVAGSISCLPAGPATVTGFSNVTYPNTGVEPYYPTFPLTTAYGWGSSNYCKIGNFSTTGANTTVSTLCFTAGGTPTSASFTQSLLASTYPGPC